MNISKLFQTLWNGWWKLGSKFIFLGKSEGFFVFHFTHCSQVLRSIWKPFKYFVLQNKWLVSIWNVNIRMDWNGSRESNKISRIKDTTYFGNICWKGKLTLSWPRPLSYRNQSTDLLCKSMDWFLYDNGLRHERVKASPSTYTMTQLIDGEARGDSWSNEKNLSEYNRPLCPCRKTSIYFIQTVTWLIVWKQDS